MPSAAIPQFPSPHPGDSEEVGLALCIAATYWRRGRFFEGVEYLKKASSLSSSERARVGNSRVVELTTAASELARYVEAWSFGAGDVSPASVVVSSEYASVPVLADSDEGSGRSVELSSSDVVAIESEPDVASATEVTPAQAPRSPRPMEHTMPQPTREPVARAPIATIATRAAAPRPAVRPKDATLTTGAPGDPRPMKAGPLDLVAAPPKPPIPITPITPMPVSVDGAPPTEGIDQTATTRRQEDISTRRIPDDEEYPPTDLDEETSDR